MKTVFSTNQDENNEMVNLLGDAFSMENILTSGPSEIVNEINPDRSLLDLTEDDSNSDLLSNDYFMPSILMQKGFNFTSDDLSKLEEATTNGDIKMKDDNAKKDAQVSWLSLFEELDPLSNKNLENKNGDQL